jgi:hypothetical protein
MTLGEFKALAETWGGDIERWPEHLRSAAKTLAGTPDAAAILADADELDRLIVAAKPQVSTDRVNQAMFNVVTTIADRSHRRALNGMLPWRRWFVPAASIICAAILGISLGIITPLKTSIQPTILTMVLDAGSFEPDWMLR